MTKPETRNSKSETGKPVVFLMGPTASGKTDVGLALAERLPVDLISVDSAMVYRGMDIGTAKPSSEVRRRVPHRLVDIRDPAEGYSAADFATDARREIDRSHAAGRVPLLVGGTMLYFRALSEGLSPLPPADAAIRAELTADAERHGWPQLHARLAKQDPVTARRLHPNDGQRIQRALEIVSLTGRPASDIQGDRQTDAVAAGAVRLALVPGDRARLHQRIETRFHAMLDQGFIEEVENLQRRPDLNREMPAMRAVGYRQLWHYLAGEWSYDEAVQRGIFASRQLAKRQLTWLRRDHRPRWFDADTATIIDDIHDTLARALELA